ncbi:MAG: S8 family serine peptidase [Candidatus Woesearchaeota archaeon]
MRNTITALVLAILIASVAVLAAPAKGVDVNSVPRALIRTSDANLDYIPGMIVVKYSDLSKASDVVQKHKYLSQASSVLPVSEIDIAAKQAGLDRIIFYDVPVNVDARKLAEQIANEPGVEYAEPDTIMHVTTAPNDALFDQQWALNNVGQPIYYGTPDSDIDYPEAFDFASGSGTIIAMIDSGVDYDHPDLVNNFWVNPGEDLNHNGVADWYPEAQGGDLNGVDDDGNCGSYPAIPPGTQCVDDLIGYDFITGYSSVCAPDEDCTTFDNNVSDVLGHGSSTTGIAGASTNNGIGVAGTCPNCKLMILRNCMKTTTGNTCSSFSASWGVYYAVEKGAKVISMSFGGTGISSYLNNSLQYAHNNGLVLVAGAGNEGNAALFYPAAYPNVISVANTDQFDVKVSSSSYGTWVDLAAPGFSVKTTNYIGGWSDFGGTSASGPFVAGVVGMLLNANPSLTPMQVEAAIKNGADNIDAENPSYIGLMGAGRLNAFNSLCLVKDCRPDVEALNVATESGYFGVPLQINLTITANHPYAWDVPYRIYDGVGNYVYGMANVPANGQADVIEYVTFNQPGFYNGAYVEVDWNGTINESNEANNQAPVQFTVLDSRPDVQVESVQMQSSPVPRSGKEAVVAVVISNDKDYAIEVPYQLDLGSGDPTVSGSILVPANSAAQADVPVVYSIDGVFNITVTADFDNVINESNEANNLFVLPNVTIQNIAPMFQNSTLLYTIFAGEQLPIEAVATDANEDVISFNWYIWNDGWVLKGTGSTQTFVFPAGTYRAKVIADDGTLSDESAFTISVIARPPKIPTKKFTLVAME